MNTDVSAVLAFTGAVLVGLSIGNLAELNASDRLADQTRLAVAEAGKDIGQPGALRTGVAMVAPELRVYGGLDTGVTIVSVGGGWYAVQVMDRGMVTGELIRFHAESRQARFGTRAPAGWTLGGR